MVTWDWINKHEGQRDFINPWLHKFDIYFHPWASILRKPLHAYGTNVSRKCWRVRVTVKIIGEKGLFSFVGEVRRETAQWIEGSIYWTSAQMRGVTGQKWKQWKSSEVSEHTHFFENIEISRDRLKHLDFKIQRREYWKRRLVRCKNVRYTHWKKVLRRWEVIKHNNNKTTRSFLGKKIG